MGEAWVYYARGRGAGIYDFRLRDNGSFVLKARNLFKETYKVGDRAEIALTIGSNEFSTRAVIVGSIPRPFVEIIPDKLGYTVGEKARVKVEVKLVPLNPEVEYVAVLRKNGEEQYGEEGVYQLTLKTPGTVTLEAQVFSQSKRMARGMQEAIQALRRERDEIRNKLEDGVDEETREALEKRLQVVERNLRLLKEELGKIRTRVGVPETEEIYVE